MRFRLGIKKKVFLATLTVFALFIATNLILNSLFFEKFYINKKERELQSISSKFKKDYDGFNGSDSFNKVIKEYEDENNMKIVVLHSDNTITVVAKAQDSKGDLLKARMLTQFIYEWAKESRNIEELDKKENITAISNELRDPKIKNLINITKSESGKDIIFTMYSLQPVNDASTTIKEFYLFSCILAIILVIILSFIFSKMISKPLLKISHSASKMANLDFESKCEVKTRDEFETVASSLNFLSENLNSALNSLKEANAKLEEDIEKERKLEMMRREFIAAISHELKTPITLIDGYAVGLKDEIFEEEDKDFYLDIIIDESEKMARLVEDMLKLSYLESSNFKLNKEEFDLKELITITIKKYLAMIEEKNVELKLNLISKNIIADWDKMEQVLTNFITNAIKHVNEKGTINISMRENADDLLVEVENTGKYIPEEELSNIWRQFYKVDKSRNRKLGGTGLGLSITKNILEHHDFRYGVENTEKGVKFYFIVKIAPLIL